MCVSETLGEDNIMELRFENLKKDLSVELAIYIIKLVVEESRRKSLSTSWSIQLLKGHKISIRHLNRVN